MNRVNLSLLLFFFSVFSMKAMQEVTITNRAKKHILISFEAEIVKDNLSLNKALSTYTVQPSQTKKFGLIPRAKGRIIVSVFKDNESLAQFLKNSQDLIVLNSMVLRRLNDDEYIPASKGH